MEIAIFQANIMLLTWKIIQRVGNPIGHDQIDDFATNTTF